VLVSQQTNHAYEFGPFQLVPEERLLFCNGDMVALSPKDMDLLLVLVGSRGRLLQKDELMKHLWPESFVEEANLSHHVFILRKVLSEHGAERSTSRRCQSTAIASWYRSGKLEKRRT
jgi:DNA-binding winged helix-turn-helix (wHTH) protein